MGCPDATRVPMLEVCSRAGASLSYLFPCDLRVVLTAECSDASTCNPPGVATSTVDHAGVQHCLAR